MGLLLVIAFKIVLAFQLAFKDGVCLGKLFLKIALDPSVHGYLFYKLSICN